MPVPSGTYFGKAQSRQRPSGGFRFPPYPHKRPLRGAKTFLTIRKRCLVAPCRDWSGQVRGLAGRTGQSPMWDRLTSNCPMNEGRATSILLILLLWWSGVWAKIADLFFVVYYTSKSKLINTHCRGGRYERKRLLLLLYIPNWNEHFVRCP